MAQPTNNTTRVVNTYAITLTMAGWVVDLGGSDTCTFPGSQEGYARAAALAERMDPLS